MVVTVVTFVIGSAGILLILWPYLEKKPTAPVSKDFLRQYESLSFERERILLNIKDLEMDLRMQKIDKSDFENLRAQLLSEAGKIYSEIEKLETENEFFKTLAADLRKVEAELK